MEHSLLLIFMTLAIVALIDYLPRAFMIVKKAVKVRSRSTPVPRYLIMPTVYGDISYLQNIDFLKRYADKVVICTSTFETQKFYDDLQAACSQYGFRYVKAQVPVVKGVPVKNAYTIYAGAFVEPELLVIPDDTPCVLIDADTFATKNVNNLIRTFQQHKLDIASLRCEVASPTKVIEVLQDFEYTLAMDNRRMDPWLTSGACNMAQAGVFRSIFARHSHFFAGGDIEIGKLAQVMGYKLRHIDFTFYTAVPDTFKDWFKQRVIWFAGGFRHHVINICSYGWHHFFMLFYNSLIIYMLFPLRWIEMLNFPLSLAMLIGLSWLYTAVLILGKKRWRKEYLLLPFYAFIQSMIILPCGIVRYIKLAWRQRSWGLLQFDLRRKGLAIYLLYSALNLASAAIVVYFAFSFTATRVDYWVHNGEISKLISGQ